MTDTLTNEAPAAPGKRPSHIAYQVRDGKDDDSYWDRVGVAWTTKDGKGLSLQLHALPLSGRIVLRVPEKR